MLLKITDMIQILIIRLKIYRILQKNILFCTIINAL